MFKILDQLEDQLTVPLLASCSNSHTSLAVSSNSEQSVDGKTSPSVEFLRSHLFALLDQNRPASPMPT